MKVDQHISELLIDHDCVVVPSFGGFLASYQHATIHPVQHTFSPPSKKIAFNVFLTHNDGLLAHHMAGQSRVSYEDALHEIGVFVRHCMDQLNTGKPVILECIGTFYFDKEKNLQFEASKQVNYLRDAFGCSTIQYLPVNRSSNEVTNVQPKKIAFAQRPSEKQEKPETHITSKKRSVTVVIVAGALIWLSFNLYIISPDRFDLGSLNPFSSKNNTAQKHEEAKPGFKQEAAVISAIIDSSEPVATASTEMVETASVKEPEVASSSTVSIQQEITPGESKKYFVIGGAFQYRENADAFVKTLHAEGFPDAQILDTTRNLKMVCFNRFASMKEATEELNRLTAMNKSGWIYAR